MIKADERKELSSEHMANALTHWAGFGLSVAGLILLTVFTSLHKGVWEVVSCSVYGVTLVILYLVSALYHSMKSPKARKVFNTIDHAAIYLLIAGTYTPYVLVPLRHGPGWTLFWAVWGLAAAGIVFQALCINRHKIFSTLTYLAMGWMVMAAIGPLIKALPLAGVMWLAAGGLCYTFGIIFYAWQGLRFAHALWHLFVLAGSLCHFFGILFFIAI